MGHYCKVCGRTRANEKFTGKGHKNHICKDCAKKPHKNEEVSVGSREKESFGRKPETLVLPFVNNGSEAFDDEFGDVRI